jgi:hypothetical protein
MKCFGWGNCLQVQGKLFLDHMSPLRCPDCRHPMQEADQILVIFQEGAGVPFTIALLYGDVDSAEQAIFTVPRR